MSTVVKTFSDGRPFLVTSPLEFAQVREDMLKREPATREMSYRDLYPLALRELARVNGIDFDKMEREALEEKSGPETGIDSIDKGFEPDLDESEGLER